MVGISGLAARAYTNYVMRNGLINVLTCYTSRVICLGVLRKRFASVRNYAAAFTLRQHPMMIMVCIVTSLALKYLGVLQHPQAPTCLRPCMYSELSE